MAQQPAQPSTLGMFSDTLTPKITADPDRVPVELGVRFTPKHAGEVTALQYYQGAKAKDVTTATLWSSSGRELARAKFDATTNTGWRTIKLDKPVALKSGSSYVVSYHAPKGGYVATEGDLTKAKTVNGFSLRSGAGVYKYSKTSTLPTQSYRGTNYLVDIVYSTTPEKPTPPVEEKPTPPTEEPTPPTEEPTPPVEEKPTPPVEEKPTPPTEAGKFPTAATAGLPAGWTPKREVTGDFWVRTAGAVVEDLRITNGTIYVDAPNVTLRRIEAVGSGVINDYADCRNGLLIEDSNFVPNGTTSDKDLPVIGAGGYTANNIKIDGVPEGLRVSGRYGGCGPTAITNSFIRVTPPTVCNDWHGDGIQGYQGTALTVRNTAVIMEQTSKCGGTSPFFYPHSQGNTSVDIDGLLVSGGGYSFRNGMPGSVQNLFVVDRSWDYGPVDVNCSVLSAWSAQTATLDAAGQPVALRSIACSGEGN